MTWTAVDRVRYSRLSYEQMQHCRLGVMTGLPLVAASRANSVVATVSEFVYVWRSAHDWRIYTHTYQFARSSLLARRAGHSRLRAQKQYWAPWRYRRPPVLYG